MDSCIIITVQVSNLEPEHLSYKVCSACASDFLEDQKIEAKQLGL